MTKKSVALVIFLAALGTLPACRKKGSGNSSAQAAGPVVPPPAPPHSAGPAVVVSTPTQAAPRRPRISVAPITARNDELWYLAHRGAADMNVVCARGYAGGAKQAASVTHYFIAPGSRISGYRCRNGLGYYGQPAMAGTCLHPCRTVAADPRFYRPGEILFFKNLVGLKCGSGRNQMIHDGFVVVADNGNPEAINIEGRFGIFWGRCQTEQNGFCLDDGAIAMDFALTFSPYCRAWRPQDPLHHDDIKLAIYNQVRSEAVRRGDNHAASSFDLDNWIGIGIDRNGILFRR